MEKIKIVCMKDVVMLDDGRIEFAQGKIYEAKKAGFSYTGINNSGREHILGCEFFAKHFIELDTQKEPTYVEKLLQEEKGYIEDRIGRLEKAIEGRKESLLKDQEELNRVKKNLAEVLKALES